MSEFRILVNRKIFLGDWSNCERMTIQDMQKLEANLNELYPNDWQLVFR